MRRLQDRLFVLLSRLHADLSHPSLGIGSAVRIARNTHCKEADSPAIEIVGNDLDIGKEIERFLCLPLKQL